MKDADWDTLEQVIAGYNKSPHRKLLQVDKPEHSVAELRPGHAESINRRRRELRAARGFRVLLKA